MSHLYLIEAMGTPYAKIGWAGNPDLRLADLQAACPLELRIRSREWGERYYARIEKQLHEIFAAYRHRNEWFRLPPEMLDRVAFARFVRTLRREHELARMREEWANAKEQRAVHTPLHSERLRTTEKPLEIRGCA